MHFQMLISFPVKPGVQGAEEKGNFFFFLPMKTWIQFNRNQIQKYGLSLCPLTEYHPGEIVEVATGVREEGRQEGREEGKRGC